MLKIIAEIGNNHEGNINNAYELVRLAKFGGADCVKFQLYSSQHIFGDDSRAKYELSYKQIEGLKSLCDTLEIELFASVFDEERLQWCEDIGVDRYKIASRTYRHDFEFVEKVIDIGKPTYISLGMIDPFASDYPLVIKPNVIYFNCVSKYPTTYDDLSPMNFDFNDDVLGWSDHTIGISACLLAISRGAQYIEKHFTMDKSMGGIRDHICSMTLSELQVLSTYGRELWALRHKLNY